MTISGFTFLRNAHKLYYPVLESIKSILNYVDEYVIALGEGDADDTTLELLKSINSDKIKIVHSQWDTEKYPSGTVYAQQTDLAKQHCSGDWLFYLQADEVIHQYDIPEIVAACKKYTHNTAVEGFVFNYLHFWGDYDHYFADHSWYKKEIRIIRNLPDIHSWRDAQSFRVYEDNPENVDYLQRKYTRPLQCILLNARVFHYGWVRPPKTMFKKNIGAQNLYNNQTASIELTYYDYGRMDFCKVFTHSHPAVMAETIAKHNWKELLRYSGPNVIGRKPNKHEKPKYRILSWIEENILGGRTIGGFKNYKALKP
jgi:hypothetical protein